MICCGPEFPLMEFDIINLIIATYESELIRAARSFLSPKLRGGYINFYPYQSCN
jgi:hypothetical protein